MEKEQLIECYKFCLNQGWVHNTPIDDIVDEYFSKIGRKKMYNNHLQAIINKDEYLYSREVHILIGEAPPYYPNKKYPSIKNRKYFYDPNQSMDTPYFKQVCANFLNVEDNSKEEKQDMLNKLKNNGVLIFDIFPFPIFQSTAIRENINLDEGDSKKSMFNLYLDNYFKPRFDKLIELLIEKGFKRHDIKLYLFAPKLASIQFLFWFQSDINYDLLEKFGKKFNSLSEKKDKNSKTKLFINKSLEKFIHNLPSNDKCSKDEFIDKLKTHPIFMNESGNPDFNNFVNGVKKNK
jgi:hypothetical protein